MAKSGLGKLHKDVVEYGRRLLRDGWVKMDEDPLGNPRYSWPGSPAILTLSRTGHGRWRQDADDMAARITGRRSHRGNNNGGRRLTAVPDVGSVRAEQQRIQAATSRDSQERQRQHLIAVERNFNMYRDLMSRAPGRW